MGTKNSPGRFDCYDKAEPDEPLFTLLGRDKLASSLVLLWASLREQEEGETDKVREAKECAAKMRLWWEEHEKSKKQP